MPISLSLPGCRLEKLDASTTEARAAQLLHGLGFTKTMQKKRTRDFSGGWRMRIALARALFVDPTFLILDEPTNHLDLEACVWLEDVLSQFKRILLLVSHSQDFMNGVCTNIINMHQKSLHYYAGAPCPSSSTSCCCCCCCRRQRGYHMSPACCMLHMRPDRAAASAGSLACSDDRWSGLRQKLLLEMCSSANKAMQSPFCPIGPLQFRPCPQARLAGNYDTYIRTRREQEENQMKKYKWEQEQIKDMKEYIARFGHGSAKLARQAQSKEKTLEKMVSTPCMRHACAAYDPRLLVVQLSSALGI